MTEPNVQHGSAPHEQPPTGEPNARASRARTQDSVPDKTVSYVDFTQRARAKVSERLGKPISEPPPAAADEAGNPWKDGLKALPQWSEPSPSLRAIWHDLIDGGDRAFEESGLPMAAAYYAIGVPGFVIVCLAETVKLSAARPGRAIVSCLVILLFWSALVVGGVNPF